MERDNPTETGGTGGRVNWNARSWAGATRSRSSRGLRRAGAGLEYTRRWRPVAQMDDQAERSDRLGAADRGSTETAGRRVRTPAVAPAGFADYRRNGALEVLEILRIRLRRGPFWTLSMLVPSKEGHEEPPRRPRPEQRAFFPGQVSQRFDRGPSPAADLPTGPGRPGPATARLAPSAVINSGTLLLARSPQPLLAPPATRQVAIFSARSQPTTRLSPPYPPSVSTALEGVNASSRITDRENTGAPPPFTLFAVGVPPAGGRGRAPGFAVWTALTRPRSVAGSLWPSSFTACNLPPIPSNALQRSLFLSTSSAHA